MAFGVIPYTPPALAGGYTTVNLPTTGNYIQTFADNVDVLYIWPGVARTGRIGVQGGRNHRHVGGKVITDAAAGNASISHSNIGDGGSVWLEGLHIDQTALDLRDAINIQGKQSGTPTFPRYFLINCRVNGVHTSSVATLHPDILQTQGPVGAGVIYGLTGDSTYQGLFIPPQTAGTFTNPPYTYGSLQIDRVNLTAKPSVDGAAPNGGYMLWFNDHGAGVDTETPYPVTLGSSVYVDTSQKPVGYTNMAAFGVWPHKNQADVNWRAIEAGDGSVTWPATPQITGSVKSGQPAGGDFVPAVDVGLNYVSPGYSTGGLVGTIDYQRRPAYSGSILGTIFVDNARNGYNVQSAFVAAGGTTLTVNDTDNGLVNALDGYFPIYRTGSSPGGSPPATTVNEFLRWSRADPAVAGYVPTLQADGTVVAAAGGASSMVERGRAAVSTAYAKGDAVTDVFGNRIVITTAQTSSAFATFTGGTYIVLSSPDALSVKDFGAVGDGTTNDTVAIQAAITAANGLGGRPIIFPPTTGNIYRIGTPGLVWPTSCQNRIELRGQGVGGNPVATARPTVLKRTGTGFPLISGAGTGTTDPTICTGMALTNLTLDGNASADTILFLDRCAGGEFKSVRLFNGTGRGLYARQLWNTTFDNCRFEVIGTVAGDLSATYLDDRGAAATETNTVQFNSCTWEGNTGDDVILTGTTSPCTAVMITAAHIERGARHGVRFIASNGCSVSNSYMYADKASSSCISHEGGQCNQVNTPCQSGGSHTGSVISCTGGRELRLDVTVLAPAGSTGITLGTSMGTVNIDAIMFPAFPTTHLTDSRTTKAGTIKIDGRVHGYDGISTKTKAGAVVDGDFTTAPPDGTIAYDSTNQKIYVRSGGTWRSTAALT